MRGEKGVRSPLWYHQEVTLDFSALSLPCWWHLQNQGGDRAVHLPVLSLS